jgi:hypothetical protein
VTFDDTVRAALDRIVTGVRAQLESDLRASSDELTRAAAAERAHAAAEAADAAAAEVRRQAQAQLIQVRDATRAQTDALRKSAEAQALEFKRRVEELRARHQQEIEAARRQAQALLEDAQRMSQAQMDDIQRGFQDRLATAQREIEAMRREIEVARRQAQDDRARAAAVAEELVIAQLAAAHADHERQTTAAVDMARADSHQLELANAARLVDAVRAIDEAKSIGEVLDALAHGAGREADRVAVLVVKGDRLQGWRFTGFGPDGPTARSVTLPLDDAGLPATAIRSQSIVSRAGIDHARQAEAATTLPPFARPDGAGRHALALPINVGGAAVAVVYADAPRVDAPTAAGRWPAILEVLSRHASRALEALTVEQATGLALPRPVARASHAFLPGPVEHAGDGDENIARRYARLLLSEVRMFNEPVIDAGRKSRDLLTRLDGEIARARRLYEARVPTTCTRRTEFFDQELVRTLADGDRTLLGSIQ